MSKHKPFENKSPELADLLANLAPSGKDPRLGSCAICGNEVDPDQDFRDALSLREWTISGMCQKCQDDIFGAQEVTMTIDTLTDQLCAEGYHFGASSPEVGQQDAAESESHPCRKCGGQVTYLGFHQPGSYRAFTICNDCGHVAEF